MCNTCKWKCNNELMNGDYCWVYLLELKEAWNKCNGIAYEIKIYQISNTNSQ